MIGRRLLGSDVYVYKHQHQGDPNARVNAESDGRKMLKRATRGAWVPTSYVLRDIKTGVEDRLGWRHVGATAKTSTLSHEMAVSLFQNWFGQ